MANVTEQPVLKINNLTTSFATEHGRIEAISNISFEIGKGETVAVVGESGCGKSVTSLSLMDLLPPGGKVDQGNILFEGKDLMTMSNENKRKLRGSEMGMIFQEPLTSLNPIFKVGDQISEALRLHQGLTKEEAKTQSINMLERVKIPRAEQVFYQYPHSLSGGMRQRVMIAMAMSCDPKLLICDEPTTALDVTIQAQILRLMKDLSQEFQTSLLLITHDLGVVAEMADRVVVMYAGQVVEETDVFTLFEHPKHPYTKGLLKSTPQVDQEDDELTSIQGTVPTPFDMPEGCRFHPRCEVATDICKNMSPNLQEVSSNQSVRCFNAESTKVAI